MSLYRATRVIPRATRLSLARGYASDLTPNTKFTPVTHPDTEAPQSTHDMISEHSHYLLNTYARPPILFEKGQGLKLTDSSGREYLDFSAGIAVLALGHSDPEVAKIMGEQASELSHVSNVYWNRWAGELAKSLVEGTRESGGLGLKAGEKGGAKVFFANSGTEANEGALKFARKVGKDRGGPTKTGLVCFSNAFHGRSMGALSVTPNPKYQDPFAPLIPNVKVGAYNDANEKVLNALIDQSTAGVILEPVQGEGGLATATPEFIQAVAKRAREVGAVLIYDEIQCGLFRTGDMWAHCAFPKDAYPDIVTMAKPLANGFPIGAIMVRDEVADAIGQGSHGTTFGGQPLAARLGAHVVGRLRDPAFRKHIQEVSQHLDTLVERLPKLFPDLIKDEKRGRGLIRGIAFKDESMPGQLVKLARERGVLLLTAGKDCVRLIPALTVTNEEADHAMAVIESCLSILQKENK